MSRNLTSQFLRETQDAIDHAISIADVTRIARAQADAIRRATCEYSADDLAWFRRPLGGK